MDRTALEVVLGRYALGEVLGHGGSATVYRAWDRRTDRAVALKRFAHGADGPDRHRQRAEVRTLARLDHPGLVRLLDAGTEDGQAHLVMDLVHGPSLAQRLADGCLPVPDVVALGSSLADALAYIHAEEITHRDVKPANVLLDPAYGPRLADFGIARLVDSTRVTATDAVVGTAAYMAPEQLRCAAVGPAADVYALGLVLLEAATGGLGLPGTGLEMVLTRLNTAPSIPAEWPASLRTLLQTMTDASPQRRPSAWQVAAALRAIADDPETDVPLGVAATSTTTTAGLGHPGILRASRSGPTWRRRPPGRRRGRRGPGGRRDGGRGRPRRRGRSDAARRFGHRHAGRAGTSLRERSGPGGDRCAAGRGRRAGPGPGRRRVRRPRAGDRAHRARTGSDRAPGHRSVEDRGCDPRRTPRRPPGGSGPCERGRGLRARRERCRRPVSTFGGYDPRKCSRARSAPIGRARPGWTCGPRRGSRCPPCPRCRSRGSRRRSRHHCCRRPRCP
jgi:hypothetical protein